MTVPLLKMNDGLAIPQLGYGVWKISESDVCDAVKQALKIGYRHIDTAKAYDNETGVGRAIGQQGLERKKIFLATKVWNSDQGYDKTMKAFEESAKRLHVDAIDLYLIHWPVPARDLFVDTWKALIRLKQENRVRSIGVCNFRIVDLERLIKETGVVPAVNQVELHPRFQQKQLRIFHDKNNILTEAWAPLGRGQFFDNAILKKIADEHQKTVAQIILRWHMEMGTVAIPKSQSPARMAENFNIFDFQLTAANHDAIASLDRVDGRLGPNPSEFQG
ncbi:aldo/keto reductase [uncultured Bartonella sp.]|uniref:aldo/keto reductase n=1 Tax=uncultured Bartonella sp. TaxID=104108 RepID=UPI002613A9FC|nr:aldo/keto reductase [uncultured Bartonella sp.]